MLIAFDHWFHKLPTIGQVVRIRKDGRRRLIDVSTRPSEKFSGTIEKFIKENGRTVDRKDLIELFNETVREMAEVAYQLKFKEAEKRNLKKKKINKKAS